MSSPTTTPPDLTSSVEAAVAEALNTASIYDIGSYGWLNENDVDPDMVGHAMWQTAQPDIDHAAVLGEHPVARRPPEQEKVVLTLGEDFWGLMQASRLSLGLALVWLPTAQRDVLNESQFFWLHHMDASLKLAIAADRLRDLLVASCTGQDPDSYKRVHKQNRLYATPFKDAAALLAARGIADQRLIGPTASLEDQGLRIFEYINRQNPIVHEVATRMARFVGGTVSRLQEQYDQEKTKGFAPRQDPSVGDWRAVADARIAERLSEISLAVEELKNWYLLLIQASNNVFQVEHWSRTLPATRPHA